MNPVVVQPLLGRSLAREITFPELLATLASEGVESYHLDFLRDECRYYGSAGETLALEVPLVHGPVAGRLSIDELRAANQRSQSGAPFTDFVRDAPAAGCACYAVYPRGRKVRYFGRNGEEHVQDLPGSICRSAVKSVDIQAPFELVFDFLADPLNWPRYAIVNLREVRPGRDGWFHTTTRFGEGELKVEPVRELGLFDHTWKDSQATWKVPARVVPNQDGVTVTFTLHQPATMTESQFKQALDEMDRELDQLRFLLEES